MQDSNLYINILGNVDGLVNAVRVTKSNLDSLSNTLKRTGARLSLGLTIPMKAAVVASAKMATDMEESLNKVNVAFGESSDEVKDFAKTTLKQFGIARGSALEMTSLFGDMATGMGMSRSEAAKMSTQLTGLAGDLASFKNINIQEAMTALSGVFTGETESLKRLGVVMTEANLEQYRLEQGIGKSVKKMTQQEKIMLRLNYIFSVTKNAQGDFARTSDSAANQTRIFTEGLKELSASFGEILVPILAQVVKKINDVIQKFLGLDEQSKKVVLVIGAIIAAVPLLVTALGFLLAPLNLIVAGLAAIAIVVYTQWDRIAPEIVKITNRLIELYNTNLQVQKSVALIRTGFSVAFATINYMLKNTVGLLMSFVNTIINSIKLFNSIGELIMPLYSGKTLGEEIDAVTTSWNSLADSMGDGLSTFFGVFDSSEYKSSIDDAKRYLGDIGKPLEKITTESLNDGIKVGVEDMKTRLSDAVDEIGNAIGLKTKEVVEDGVVDGVVEGFDKVANVLSGVDPESEKGKIDPEVGKYNDGMALPVQEKIAVFELPFIDFDEQKAEEELAQFIEANKRVIEEGKRQKQLLENLNQALTGTLNAFISDTIYGIAEAFGKLIAGTGDGIYSLSNVLLTGMGNMLKQFGKQLIAYGVAVEAFKMAFKKPKMAILAGIALTIIGSAITSSLQKNATFTPFANGGIVSAPTLGLMGEYPGARSNPEVIAPLDKLKTMMPQSNGGNVNVSGEFVVRGQDLVVALERANRSRNKFI